MVRLSNHLPLHFGYNELWCAGALRNEPIQIVDGVAVDEVGIARAEFIIEAEIMPNETMQEDINTNSGKTMPEFPGYTGMLIQLYK